MAEYELTNRGDDSFPLEYYYLDADHPRYVMPYHWHMDYELVRVISGELPLHVGSTSFSLVGGDCVLVPPGAIHGSMPPSGEYECVVFDISRLFADGTPGHKALSAFWDMRSCEPLLVRKDDPMSLCTERFFHAARDREESAHRRLLSAVGALLTLFGERYEELTHTPSAYWEKSDRVKRVISYIRENYTSRITLGDLSVAVGLNREYLCREFKAAIGMSPIGFLIEYRVEQSKKVLLSPNGSVTEAALSSGFSDISYYIKKFTALNGCTPLQFRRERKGNSESN